MLSRASALQRMDLFARARAHVEALERRRDQLEADVARKAALIDAHLKHPVVVVTGPRRSEAAKQILAHFGVHSEPREGEPVPVTLSNKYFDAEVAVIMSPTGHHSRSQAIVVACSTDTLHCTSLETASSVEARVCWCLEGEPETDWRLRCLDAQFECLESGDEPGGTARIAEVISTVMWQGMRRRPKEEVSAKPAKEKQAASKEKELAKNEALEDMIMRAKATAQQARSLPDVERRAMAARVAMDLLAALDDDGDFSGSEGDE